MNNDIDQQKNEIPLWLKLLLIIGGTALAGYLIECLFEALFGEEDRGPNPRVFVSHSWKNDRDYWN